MDNTRPRPAEPHADGDLGESAVLHAGASPGRLIAGCEVGGELGLLGQIDGEFGHAKRDPFAKPRLIDGWACIWSRGHEATSWSREGRYVAVVRAGAMTRSPPC